MAAQAKHDLPERVRRTVEQHGLLPPAGAPPETVVVATSGGPDSVALLLTLAEVVRSRRLPVTLVVAHLHHGLRDSTADADQVFVENLSARLGLECETARADVRAEAAAASVGIEEAARETRRRFLADVARRRGATRVALGHTLDDRAETVLFNVLRGTGIEGLAAMPPRAPLAPAPCRVGAPHPRGQDGASCRVGAPHPREQEGRPAESGGCEAPTLHPVSEPDAGTSSQRAIEIVRPLIDVARAEVLAFLEAAGQLWREDETNASDAFTRNRLRHEILPLVRDAVNPKADEALARLADQAAAAGNVLADALDAVWRQIVRETPAGAILIDADDFVPLRPWLQGAILRQAVERLGGGLKHMSAERTRAAVDALLARTVAGPVDLPGGLVAQRRRRVIRIGPRET